MDEAAFVLENLLRGVTTLGLIVLCFGQSYARLVLLLYGGKALATGLGPRLLKTHCLAILLIAVNGSTECYVHSTIHAKQFDRYDTILLISKLLYRSLF